jgi:hypothetical protein
MCDKLRSKFMVHLRMGLLRGCCMVAAMGQSGWLILDLLARGRVTEAFVLVAGSPAEPLFMFGIKFQKHRDIAR